MSKRGTMVESFRQYESVSIPQRAPVLVMTNRVRDPSVQHQIAGKRATRRATLLRHSFHIDTRRAKVPDNVRNRLHGMLPNFEPLLFGVIGIFGKQQIVT